MEQKDIYRVRGLLQRILGYIYTDTDKAEEAVRNIAEILKKEEQKLKHERQGH